MPLESRWLAGHWQGTASLSTMKALRISTALNKCHAPISRIKPSQHLLYLTLPLFVLWYAVTVNDFLKIAIFHVWFTCLKCLVEQTQVCKATITAKLNADSVWAKLRNFISKARVDQEETDKVSAYCLSVSSCLHIWIVQSSLPVRITASKNNYTPHPHPSTSLSPTASTQLDNQAH